MRGSLTILPLAALAALAACGDGTGSDGDDRRLLLALADDQGERLAYGRADGSRLRSAPDTEAAEQGTWSPDGRSIALIRLGAINVPGSSRDLWLLDVASGRVSPLLTTPGAEERNPDWSPDGRSIAFERGDSVWVTSAAGGAPTFVVRGVSPAWHPDGRITYTSLPTGGPPTFRLMAIAPTGGTPVAVTAEDSLVSFPALQDATWSRGGRLAVVDARGTYPNGTVRWSLLLLDPATGARASILSDSMPILQPAWSPDGTRLVLVRMRSDGSSVWSIAADGSGLRRLTPGTANPAAPAASYTHPRLR